MGNILYRIYSEIPEYTGYCRTSVRDMENLGYTVCEILEYIGYSEKQDIYRIY